MLRSLCYVAVCAFLSVSVAYAEEKAKTPAPPAKPAEAKPAASWVPHDLQGTPAEKRLITIKADLDAALAKRGEVREAADKARVAAMQTQQKSDDLNRLIKFLEEERAGVLERGMAQAKEASIHKAAFETSQKVSKLEAQVRDLMAQLAAGKQQTAAAPCKEKDKKAVLPVSNPVKKEDKKK